jgi:hypothetical protein
MVPFPTHLCGNTLDLVLTDIPERVTDVQDEGRLGSSDHVIISFNLVIKSGAQQAHRDRPDWHRADWDSMRRELARVNWDEQLRGRATEEAWALLRDRLHGLIEKHVPPRRRRNHNRPPWLSRDILRAIRRKNGFGDRRSRGRRRTSIGRLTRR